jgi:hypothetical protein
MSDKPVAKRLQVKSGRRLAVVGASVIVGYKIGVNKQRCDICEADVVLLFAANRGQLDLTLPSMLEKAPQDAIIWIAYPKLTSKLADKLSRNLFHALPAKSGWTP